MNLNNKIWDVIIIGAGPGGYETAIYAANNGLKVLLIEKDKLGGTCLNCGCIPTKTYYTNALLIDEIKKLTSNDELLESIVDFPNNYNQKEEVILQLQKNIEFMLLKAGVTSVYGKAKVIGENEVLVDDKIFTATNIIIATGSVNKRLNIKGSEHFIDSEALLSLKTLPESLTIVGGGVIGVEMATIFASFGTKVNIVESLEFLLPNFDKEVSRRVQANLKKLGINIYTKSTITSLNKNEDDLITSVINSNNLEFSITTDKVLLAIGRRPNITDLGLDSIGIVDENNNIVVNQHFQTPKENIFAIGDCIGKVMLAHYASYSGKYVIDYLLNKNNYTNFSLIPSVVFTIPEVATIGITEEDAKNKETEYIVKKVLYRSNGKAVASRKTEGFIKAIISNNKLIGVSIVGADASVLIHEAAVMMNADLNVHEIKDYIFAHPTLSELYKDLLN